jgi:hypothetical protein
MAIKKDGELRVLRGSSLYGPMTRADLERLLDRGRIEPTDQVSVWDGPWIAIGDYLSQCPQQSAPAAAAELQVPAPSRPVPKGGTLRLLVGNKVFASLSREQVSDLRSKRRVDDDDLVCTLNGPWMRLGDFLAPPAASARSMAPQAEECPQQETGAGATEEIIEAVEVVETGEEKLKVLGAPDGHRIDELLRPSGELTDEWYVKVKGIHSAPLKKLHVRALFLAREITPDCLARHARWRVEHWVPLRAIPELAQLVAP